MQDPEELDTELVGLMGHDQKKKKKSDTEQCKEEDLRMEQAPKVSKILGF